MLPVKQSLYWYTSFFQFLLFAVSEIVCFPLMNNTLNEEKVLIWASVSFPPRPRVSNVVGSAARVGLLRFSVCY